ncbi:ATP-binding protein [Streptomyces sp. NBC_01465]|uniref:ATP-binding protein n=1 Tax=Streptomyces sp. NBC_01465 TaxID=2903878 RepID=UPI002E341D97|nr:ATP-binding protein [Streptomyces sp. NBC_01465]
MPEDEPWEYTISLPNDPRAVPVCRRTVRLLLALYGLPQLSELAELVVAELVSNAVRHTKGPASLRLRWAGRVLRIGVWDTDPTPPTPPAPSAAADLDTCGRGLALVRECADEWGWFPLGTVRAPGSAGKFVWCELTAAA